MKFVTPISILDHPKINEWLGLVEKQMRITLAASLAQAVEDVKVFHTTNINVPSFMEWVDKYQVWNIIILMYAWPESSPFEVLKRFRHPRETVKQLEIIWQYFCSTCVYMYAKLDKIIVSVNFRSWPFCGYPSSTSMWIYHTSCTMCGICLSSGQPSLHTVKLCTIVWLKLTFLVMVFTSPLVFSILLHMYICGYMCVHR